MTVIPPSAGSPGPAVAAWSQYVATPMCSPSLGWHGPLLSRFQKAAEIVAAELLLDLRDSD